MLLWFKNMGMPFCFCNQFFRGQKPKINVMYIDKYYIYTWMDIYIDERDTLMGEGII